MTEVEDEVLAIIPVTVGIRSPATNDNPWDVEASRHEALGSK